MCVYCHMLIKLGPVGRSEYIYIYIFNLCILQFCHTCSLCRVELVVQFPAKGSTQVLLCLFPGVLWL